MNLRDDLDESSRGGAPVELALDPHVGGQFACRLEFALQSHRVGRGELVLDGGRERRWRGQADEDDGEQPDVDAARHPPGRVGGRDHAQPAEPLLRGCRPRRAEHERQAHRGEQHVQRRPDPPGRVRDRPGVGEHGAQHGYLGPWHVEEVGEPDEEDDEHGAEQERQRDVGGGPHREALGLPHRQPGADAAPDSQRDQEARRGFGGEHVVVEQQDEAGGRRGGTDQVRQRGQPALPAARLRGAGDQQAGPQAARRHEHAGKLPRRESRHGRSGPPDEDERRQRDGRDQGEATAARQAVELPPGPARNQHADQGENSRHEGRADREDDELDIDLPGL